MGGFLLVSNHSQLQLRINPILSLNMYKFMPLLVLVALAAFVFAEEMEVQDQEAAELYYRTYGVWPSWYSGISTLNTIGGIRLGGLRTIGGITTLGGVRTLGINTLGLNTVGLGLGGVRTIGGLIL